MLATNIALTILKHGCGVVASGLVGAEHEAAWVVVTSIEGIVNFPQDTCQIRSFSTIEGTLDVLKIDV
jgi:hypothetical protein